MIGPQASAFIAGEADRWHQRNKHRLGRDDRVLRMIESVHLTPRRVLEIGCGNGWRLKQMEAQYKCEALGVEPSLVASAEGNEDRYRIRLGTADHLSFDDRKFDLVICGFFLYLVDRVDLFKVVCETDRVLADGGHLIIHDFCARPHSRVYEHNTDLRSYKMNYPDLWLGNPVYSMVKCKIFGTETMHPRSRNDQVMVAVLRKNVKDAFPLREI